MSEAGKRCLSCVFVVSLCVVLTACMHINVGGRFLCVFSYVCGPVCVWTYHHSHAFRFVCVVQGVYLLWLMLEQGHLGWFHSILVSAKWLSPDELTLFKSNTLSSHAGSVSVPLATSPNPLPHQTILTLHLFISEIFIWSTLQLRNTHMTPGNKHTWSMISVHRCRLARSYAAFQSAQKATM